MRKNFLLLEKIIKQKTKSGPVYYLNNPGNYGDSLIRYGTFKFFKDIDLKYNEIYTFNTLRPEWYKTLLPPKGTLIFAGSGAWCNFYNRESFIKKISNRFKNIIILPSTFDITTSIPNAIFFSRDKYESMKNMPNALFCDDMAFYIDEIKTQKGIGNGFFFREDIESAKKIMLPKNNLDISMKGNHLTPIFDFVDVLSNYHTIHTDRLHVAIAASLMNKEVHLYPNSYFKNKAIFLSSLKENYKNVFFHENFDF